MKRIFVPTRNGSDWQPLLAKPDVHWKPGKTAIDLPPAFRLPRDGV